VLHAAGNCGNFAAVSARFAFVSGLGFAFASLPYVVACGGPAPLAAPAEAPLGVSAPAGPLSAPPLPVTTQIDVELRQAGSAIVHGTTVPFDGLEEGLAWPGLNKALPPRKAGDVLTVQVGRGVPTIHLLRAAWTLRQADLHLQSLDASGTMHAVAVPARRDGPPAQGCHLAVFLRPDGSLRVASAGGPVVVSGDDPPSIFARSLASELAKCPFKYVAFGAESDSAPWGPVFDVMLAVDGVKAAGDARYVLGQAMHVEPKAP
jgi:hypothetical protein